MQCLDQGSPPSYIEVVRTALGLDGFFYLQKHDLSKATIFLCPYWKWYRLGQCGFSFALPLTGELRQ